MYLIPSRLVGIPWLCLKDKRLDKPFMNCVRYADSTSTQKVTRCHVNLITGWTTVYMTHTPRETMPAENQHRLLNTMNCRYTNGILAYLAICVSKHLQKKCYHVGGPCRSKFVYRLHLGETVLYYHWACQVHIKRMFYTKLINNTKSLLPVCQVLCIYLSP